MLSTLGDELRAQFDAHTIAHITSDKHTDSLGGPSVRWASDSMRRKLR